MSVKKTIEENFSPLYVGFNRLANELRSEIKLSLEGFSNKLDSKDKPTLIKRLIAIRNWLNHLILWFLLAHLLASCFVSGRTVRVVTPKVEVSADTATAYTWPYNTRFE